MARKWRGNGEENLAKTAVAGYISRIAGKVVAILLLRFGFKNPQEL